MTGQKKQLGQFFTVNSDYILNGLKIYINGKDISDPFCGSGDLLEWAKKNGAKNVIGYDIDNKYIDNKTIIQNDSLLNPKKYNFVLTNPPYLNVNKANKTIKNRYFTNSYFEDLYQISLFNILNSNEGIVIVPVNFLSAENSKKIRNIFFSKFEIKKINYFRQQVFPDTTYNVIAFYYQQLKKPKEKIKFTMKIFPEKELFEIKLEKRFNWTIGGADLARIKNQKNELGAFRLTEKDVENKNGKIKIKAAYNHIRYIEDIKISEDLYESIKNNIIMLKAIDSGSDEGKISLENIKDYKIDCLVSKNTSRHMIHILFKDDISIDDQKKLIKLFNREINRLRKEHLSLFLTNYRDKDRKRISFDLAYKLLNYLYFNNINKKISQQKLIQLYAYSARMSR